MVKIKPIKVKMPALRSVDFRTKRRLIDFQAVDFRAARRRNINENQLRSDLHHANKTSGSFDPENNPRLDDAHYQLSDHYHFSDTEKRHIAHYTGKEDHTFPSGVSSHEVNKHLFDHEGKVSSDHEESVKHIDHAINQPAPSHLHLYTSLHHAPFGGDTHQHHGYMSTTVHHKVAEDFATFGSRGKLGQNRHVLHIHVPKGSRHGAYIAHASSFKHESGVGEYEFLLKRGQKIKISKRPYKTVDANEARGVAKDTKIHYWHGRIVE